MTAATVSYLCNVSLRTSEERCICHKASHNIFRFGKESRSADIDTGDGYEVINPDLFDEVKNPFTGETCLCCDAKLVKYGINNCDTCGCFLCHRCFVHGRYGDEILCFNCRRFGLRKNIYYQLGLTLSRSSEKNNEWYMNDIYFGGSCEDWQDASWYY